MIVSWRKIFIISLMPILGGIPDARAAEWINFFPVTGELSLEVDSEWRRTDGEETTKELETTERLELNIGGYSLDPRFFNFNVRLEPELEQRTTDSGTGKFSSDSTFLNYDARFDFLSGVQASPFALSGNVAANSGEIEGSLGDRRDITNESRGANLRWKNRAGRSWRLFPDPDAGGLRTGEANPYYAKGPEEARIFFVEFEPGIAHQPGLESAQHVLVVELNRDS